MCGRSGVEVGLIGGCEGKVCMSVRSCDEISVGKSEAGEIIGCRSRCERFGCGGCGEVGRMLQDW